MGENNLTVNDINFPADDIRSMVKLYDYIFECGKFASRKDAYPNCLGYVLWINPDINALKGNRVEISILSPTTDIAKLREILKMYNSDFVMEIKEVKCLSFWSSSPIKEQLGYKLRGSNNSIDCLS